MKHYRQHKHKRSNGEGSVYRRCDGKWCAAVTQQGKRQVRYAPNRQEAEAKLVKMRAGGPINTGGPVTVADYADRWTARIRGTVKERTEAIYTANLRLHVMPHLGTVDIRTLTHAQIVEWVRTLSGEAGLAPSSVRLAHATLRTMLSAALDEGIATKNPCTGTKLPRKDSLPLEVFTRYNVTKLMQASRYDPDLHAAIVLSVMLGVRRGELLALEFSDIDITAGGSTVAINKNLSQDRHGHWIVTDPKSRQSIRTLRAPEAVSDALAALPRVTGRVIRMSPATLFLRWKRLLDTCGLPNTSWHTLRHTCASLLIRQGVTPKKISALLGHHSVAFTMDRYGHLYPDDTETMDSMAKIFSGGDSPLPPEPDIGPPAPPIIRSTPKTPQALKWVELPIPRRR